MAHSLLVMELMGIVTLTADLRYVYENRDTDYTVPDCQFASAAVLYLVPNTDGTVVTCSISISSSSTLEHLAVLLHPANFLSESTGLSWITWILAPEPYLVWAVCGTVVPSYGPWQKNSESHVTICI